MKTFSQGAPNWREMLDYLDQCSPEQASSILHADDASSSSGPAWPLKESYPLRLRIAHLGRAAQALLDMDLLPRGSLVAHAGTRDDQATNRNGQIARETLRMVRVANYDRRFGSLKSTNKWGAGQPDPMTIFETAREADRSDATGTPRAALHSAARAWGNKITNCRELSLMVHTYVAHREPTVQTSTVILEIDHGAVVLGAVDGRLRELPLAEWPTHLWICDPWANIACAARNYPQAFQDKMAKWHKDGKSIALPKGEGAYWGAPTDATWLAGAKKVSALQVRRQFENGQFFLEPLGSATPSDRCDMADQAG
ncbi:MAG: hypothetical protein EOP37_18300 [Rubrivivax sp.]|nr:MAG: hypothetical protein EOP37_18300 [Rubrivivax sp.]